MILRNHTRLDVVCLHVFLFVYMCFCLFFVIDIWYEVQQILVILGITDS